MIENHKKKYGWEILFIGANIDAGETAKHFGIDADRAVDYHADRKGTERRFSMIRFPRLFAICALPHRFRQIGTAISRKILKAESEPYAPIAGNNKIWYNYHIEQTEPEGKPNA